MFEGVELKVKWANDHIDKLRSVVEDYIGRAPYEIIINRDPGSGQCGLFCIVKEVIPNFVPLIIGDIAHNLRSALDILANDVVERDSGNRGRSDARFPIFNEAQIFEERGKKGLKGASNQSIVIFESVQPYKTGDDTLRKLHDLNIGDKHKLVTSMANFISAGGFKAVQRGTGGTMSIGKARPVDASKVGAHSLGVSWHESLGFEFQNQSQVSVEIQFNPTDTWHIADISAVEAMSQMSQAVANTIKLFF